MVQTSKGAGRKDESLDGFRVGRQVRCDDLDRHRPLQDHVPGAPYFPHPPFANSHFEDVVADLPARLHGDLSVLF